MAETKDIASSVIQNQIHGGAPAGLSMLQEVDGLFVEQQWEVLETLTCGCYESQNQYKVYDKSGKVQLFEAKEKTMFCWRYCCGEHRPFTMNVVDVTGKKNQRMAVIKRGFLPCSWAVLPCCLHSVTAHYMVDASGNAISSTSSDTVVARVKTPWLGGCCTPTLNVYDRDHTYHGALTGPFCCVCDFCGSDFAFTDAQGKSAGGIKKLGAKTMKDVVVEVSTDADKFLITFPVATKPEIKLALLAALLHLDFTFFEDPRSIREGKCCDLYICGLACACCPRWAVCCCCYATKEAREEAKKEREKRGAPQIETVMDR